MAEKNNLVSKNPQVAKEPENLRGGPHFRPLVDIFETDRELVLFADLPGVAPDDLDLRYERGQLVLHGRRSGGRPSGSLVHGEYQEGDFYRVFQVHDSIDVGRIEAECKNGVLTLHLPKEEAAQPRKIMVQAKE